MQTKGPSPLNKKKKGKQLIVSEINKLQTMAAKFIDVGSLILSKVQIKSEFNSSNGMVIDLDDSL